MIIRFNSELHVDVVYDLYFIHQCYYVGGTEDAATGMVKEVTKPLSYHMPAEKICEKLKKIDAQICELQYGQYKFDSTV